MKTSWTPISPSGFHSISQADLWTYFVEPFDERAQSKRIYLTRRLESYLADLRRTGLQMEIWLDGSFTTRCVEPDDIDLVVVLSFREILGLTIEQQNVLNVLVNERERVRLRYECDVYYIDRNNITEHDRWTRLFSTNHDGSEKGIFKLLL
ncbi:DUF6932 family protein [Hymenobacter defluvii]|uniref:DUF6932 family protein n=1 Tax=Hymenobacter defluvii TaxID=2054411 RepID=UPI003D76A0D1